MQYFCMYLSHGLQKQFKICVSKVYHLLSLLIRALYGIRLKLIIWACGVRSRSAAFEGRSCGIFLSVPMR